MSPLTSTSLWSQLADLLVAKSTCTSFCGYLLAVGGEDSHYAPTKAIHMYNPMPNTGEQSVRCQWQDLTVWWPLSLVANRLMVGGRAGAG